MKTVLLLIDTLQTGGAERSLLEITSRFKKFRPVFVQLFPGAELLPLFKERGIEVVQLNMKPDYRFDAMLKKLLPVVKVLQPAIIHSTLFRADMVSRKLAPKLQVPLINSLVNNSYSPLRFQQLPWLQRIKLTGIQWWDKLTAARVDLFLSNSNSIKESNARALQIPSDKITVIYRGRDVAHYPPIAEPERRFIRKALGIGDEKMFINVSRLLDRKGQVDLIRAFAKVAKHHEDVYLWIAGEGPYRGQLEVAIREAGLTSKVRLLGNRNDVPRLLLAADYFVFPSHYEGLPGALVEAMMARIPIIASAIPENLECVDGTMALLHARGNIDELATCIEQALSLNWTDRITAAYEKAAHDFDINSVAQQHEEVYEKLLNLQFK